MLPSLRERCITYGDATHRRYLAYRVRGDRVRGDRVRGDRVRSLCLRKARNESRGIALAISRLPHYVRH